MDLGSGEIAEVELKRPGSLSASEWAEQEAAVASLDTSWQLGG